MREPAPDYSSSLYERPNQTWMCGLASDGQTCPAGPTAHGQCPALAECTPLRDGDRWQCNRSALRGGTCTEGPRPDGGCGHVHRCQPVRSLRAKRARFVTACTLLAACVLMILLNSDWRNEFISPGPLASAHAQLEHGAANDAAEGFTAANCAACHAAAEQGISGWAATLIVGHGGQPPQSQLCMECHDKTISAEFALAAHNLPPHALRQITKKGSELFSLASHRDSLARRENSSDPFSIACATCHREHQGAQFELTAMNDAACQSCHQQRYESFAGDHPDFGDWPYERRTRIVFNHASHRAKHFTQMRQAFDCRKCHVPDATGTVQLLANYEAACAACHDDKIATSVARGLPMLALPMLDVDALREAGHDIGPWPEKASGDFDGRLPPMMKLLLAADPEAGRAMATLGADFDFFDIDPDDPDQLVACAALAKAIKKLLAELSQSGPAAVRERLNGALGRDVSDAQVNAIVAGMSIDTLQPAITTWLPNDGATGGMLSLPGGVAMTDNSVSMPTSQNDEGMPPMLEAGRPIAFPASGTWFRDDATLSIRYRPAGHADPVLTGWLELLATTPNLAQRPVALAMVKELSNPTAGGLCASCHSVEQTATGKLAINWRAYDPTTRPRSFTKFSHGPHLVLPQLEDCTRCHAIDESAVTAASYADWNPHGFASEFASLSKRMCAECHTAKAAEDRCQTCHNYHVDSVEGSGFRVQD